MLTRLLAGLSIFLGILWIIWPHLLRGWFLRKTNLTVFWLAGGALFYPLFHLGKRGGILGLIVVFTALWIVLSRMRAMTGEMFLKIPLVAFRGVGLFNVLTGIALFTKSP